MKERESENLEIIEEGEGQLTIDVYQTDDEIVVESTIAGVAPDDIDIDISSESITIRGERRKIETIPEENYLYQECYWGKFSRSIILPQEIDPDKSRAEFKNGVLKIRLPKVTRGQSRKIKVHQSEE